MHQTRLRWLAVSLFFLTAAIVVSPALVPAQLPTQAEKFRDTLASGLNLVRAGLAAAGYQLTDRLGSWVDDKPFYLVYRRRAHG